MERPVRIALIGPAADALVTDLRELPLRPEVRTWGSFLTDADGLARFQPDLLVLTIPATAEQEIGALRLLRQLWPATGVLLVTTAERELSLGPLAQRLQARLLVHPDAPGQLAAAVEQARLGSDRPRPDVFVDLARGLADEINNPLQFVAGHLQLLRASFAAAPDRDRRDQVGAALQGVERIQTSLDRLRLLAQAANGPRRRETTDLAALLAQAGGQRPTDPGSWASIEPVTGELPVIGDPEQLGAALTAIVRFADELTATGAECRLQLETLQNARRLRLGARGPSLANWHLPQTFEPFYPSRALRGQSQGLGLFLAQTVILGHRGQATVRRLGDGSLQFDFVLPA
jgi:nitrogen-specific signal transduction histidine kinase